MGSCEHGSTLGTSRSVRDREQRVRYGYEYASFVSTYGVLSTKHLPGVQCNGQDVLAVRECFRYAKDYAASGNGPMFIEVKTYG